MESLSVYRYIIFAISYPHHTPITSTYVFPAVFLFSAPAINCIYRTTSRSTRLRLARSRGKFPAEELRSRLSFDFSLAGVLSMQGADIYRGSKDFLHAYENSFLDSILRFENLNLKIITAFCATCEERTPRSVFIAWDQR